MATAVYQVSFTIMVQLAAVATVYWEFQESPQLFKKWFLRVQVIRFSEFTTFLFIYHNSTNKFQLTILSKMAEEEEEEMVVEPTANNDQENGEEYNITITPTHRLVKLKK